MYYHTMTALNDIGPGGAPFTIVDGIYPKIKKVIESFDDDYMATLVGEQRPRRKRREDTDHGLDEKAQ